MLVHAQHVLNRIEQVLGVNNYALINTDNFYSSWLGKSTGRLPVRLVYHLR
jgi:hypothetical protein